MAYPNARYGYRQTSTEVDVNSKPAPYFDEHDSGVLESALLNADIMQNSEAAQIRKGSFASNHDVISPTEPHAWTPQYPSNLRIDPVSGGPFHEDHNGFRRESPSQMSGFGHPPPPPGWGYDHHSGNCTPTTRMDYDHQPPAAPFDVPQYVHQRTDSARGSFSHNLRQAQPPPPPPQQGFHGPDDGFIPAPHVQTPMSPHSHQDWMNMAAHEVECRPTSRRMRAQSPVQTTVDFQRRDGIRKKNARIDIPHERSIQTIESLLESTTDEDLLKELKQQKRLLRNREAALASRQRKKKHTEDLESREKDFGRTLDGLQAQIDSLQLERQNQERNYQIMSHRLQEAQRHIEGMNEEKRDLMMKHTEETSTLRRRIRVLTDQLDRGPTPAMSADPSSAGFADFNAEMEALNMGAHDWDNLIFVNDLHSDTLEEINFDAKSEDVRPTPLPDRNDATNAVISASAKKINDGATDPHVTSGLLFFLLLCGAFVASKPSNSHSTDLPQVPPDVRAAAPTVLNNLLSDSQAAGTPAHGRTPHLGAEPGPSGTATTPAKSRSKLDRMHHRLTAPTRQQEMDSAFALTTTEYASITNLDYRMSDERPSSSRREDEESPRPRRILADSLASMQEEHTRNSKAEVYTRSLLWDQIPADVVKQFREMVRDHNEIEARQQQRQTNDEMNPYKVEN